MDKHFKFTDARIRALPANPASASSTDLEVSDSEITGLKCLSGKSGRKRFLLRYVYRGRKRSIALGKFPDIDVAAARKAAQQYRALLAEGRDPKEEHDALRLRPTVSEFFWHTFLPMQKKHKRTWNRDAQRFRDHIEPALGDIVYDELRASHVQQLQLFLNAPTKDREALSEATCNRVLAILKTMGQSAVRLDVVSANEAMKIRLLREDNARTRFLDAQELKRLIQVALAFEDRFIGGFVAMLAITGCRNSEIRTALWSNLNLADRSLFIPMTKSGKSRVVYLSDMALEILKGLPRVPGNPHIFPGRKPGKPLTNCRKSFRQMLLRAGIEDVDDIVLHTLRHSVASNLVSAGCSIYDVKAQLAHSSLQSTQRYAKLTVDRQRDTSERMAQLVQ
ncbi:Site-specific recombinase XerD [Marinobacter segnicrescens]|uniref:Site-specific recombinase XerD n=1 Tax=Marinobacter segnicrescens TaxID=430453 RepID=A0A1I0DSJ5_9GAMM|nr:site-specific integrase [Marinobacter segnicrescens]SET35551.1 Site-specific recombinase XerD [Marinobacter segnicrescens]